MRALVAGILAVSVSPAVAQPGTPIVVESYLIPSGDPGIQLYVRNKRPGAMTTFRTDRTVLYVHGTTQASEATFDLALDGKSWMDYLAEHGWDVWLMDVRGYGGSTKPPEMDRPAADSPPIAPAVVAVRDVRTAVEWLAVTPRACLLVPWPVSTAATMRGHRPAAKLPSR
jgi:pimeloyl-ACP methyl ester carboxylesterase